MLQFFFLIRILCLLLLTWVCSLSYMLFTMNNAICARGPLRGNPTACGHGISNFVPSTGKLQHGLIGENSVWLRNPRAIGVIPEQIHYRYMASKNFVRPDGQLLINIERNKFHKSEIISWKRHVANFVHLHKYMWELCGDIVFVWSIGQLLINIERHKFHKPEII